MDVTEFLSRTDRIVGNVERVILGKPREVRLALAGLLCRGHVLIEDAGVGKTMLSRALARSIGCQFNRIQFTPDLLPSDVTGVSIYDQGRQEFRFQPGPIFANVVLADEINRATPKAQAACWSAWMSISQCRRRDPQAARPFFVIGTENPIEYHGTYPLPEAQLDRFILRLSVGYPDHATEIEMLTAQQQQHPIDALEPVTGAEEVMELQDVVCQVPVVEKVKDYIVRLSSATRDHRMISLGASPRGSLALMRMSQAWALLHGESAPTEDHVQDIAVAVLSHRIILSPEARGMGLEETAVIEELVREEIEVERV